MIYSLKYWLTLYFIIYEHSRHYILVGAGTLSNLVMEQQTIRDGITGQQIILQQPSSGAGMNSHNQHPTIVTTSGNYLSSSGAKRQRLSLASQAADLVETHHLVVTGDSEPVRRYSYYCIRKCTVWYNNIFWIMTKLFILNELITIGWISSLSRSRWWRRCCLLDWRSSFNRRYNKCSLWKWNNSECLGRNNWYAKSNYNLISGWGRHLQMQ